MPTITFGGVGSGIDTDSIVSGLIAASRGPITRVQQQSSQTAAAVSSMSDIGNLLSKFKDSLLALDTIQEVGSFKVTSDDKAIVATASGGAQAGSFSIEVSQLASAYKAYSSPLGISKSNEALNQAGTLSLNVGGKSVDLQIDATDTLDKVMAKVNTSGLRVSATSVFDGTQFRMQLRGLDTGLENNVGVTENGTSFGFGQNVKSSGQDAKFTVDGIAVTSKSNQAQGAIPGVTLALTAVTTTAVNVNLSSDPEAFETKLKTLVEAYNGVVSRVNTEAGFGSVKASNPELSGDSTLRSLTSRLSSALTQTTGTGKFQTLRSIGIELNNNGTLKLNSTKLQAALAEDPDSVTRVLAGDDKSVDGLADTLGKVTTGLLAANGSITARKEGLAARQRALTDRVALEQKRLDRMEETLRKQFTQMDQTVSQNQAQMNFFGR
jgi:flagellar hook-associated protein 2